MEAPKKISLQQPKSFLWETANILRGIMDASEFKDTPVGRILVGWEVKDLKIISMPLPPIEEQQKIASILTSIDNNIKQKQTKLTQTKNLKKFLMLDLLTGRVRVKV